jgi:hypothetical protein
MTIRRKIIDWMFQMVCKHEWRPARRTMRSSYGFHQGHIHVKVCGKCRIEVPLDDAQFYAQFGRMPL